MIEERKEAMCINVLKLWRERKEDQINQEDRNDRKSLWKSDDNMAVALDYLDSLKTMDIKIRVESDITKNMTEVTKAALQMVDKATRAKKDKLCDLYHEIHTMLLACNGRAEDEMNVLTNYGIIDRPFGRLVNGGTHGQN